MPKLSEAQACVLKTMAEFDCPVYLSLDFYEELSFGDCWYGERGIFECPGRKVARITVLALLRTGFIVEERLRGERPHWRTVFILTPKGREVAKELEAQDVLDEAKLAIAALPGVHEVTAFVMPECVRFDIRCTSSNFLPKKTVLGILEIHDTLGGGPGWHVAFTVSAGLRIPDWAAARDLRRERCW